MRRKNRTHKVKAGDPKKTAVIRPIYKTLKESAKKLAENTAEEVAKESVRTIPPKVFTVLSRTPSHVNMFRSESPTNILKPTIPHHLFTPKKTTTVSMDAANPFFSPPKTTQTHTPDSIRITHEKIKRIPKPLLLQTTSHTPVVLYKEEEHQP